MEILIHRIIVLSRYDAIRMFVLFGCAWLIEQVTSLMVEKIIWGEHFAHWFDVAFTATLFAFFAVCASEMAKQIRVVVSDGPEKVE